MRAKKYEKKIKNCITTRCGFCEPNCPVYSVEEQEVFSARGRALVALEFLENMPDTPSKRLEEIVYKCTTCGSCSKNCSDIIEGDSFLDNVGLVEALREDLASMGSLPKKHEENGKRILLKNTPYEREKKPLPAKEGKESKNLLFVGCTYRTNDTTIPKKLVEILKWLDFDFAVLDDEPCCGSYLRKTGQKKRHDKNQKKLEALKKFDNIITMCPGCEQTLKLNGFKTKHYLLLLDELLDEEKMNKLKFGKKAFYHDPCHLVRDREWKDGRLELNTSLIEAPRSILKKLGVELAGHEKTGLDTFCCGSGGGVRAAYPGLNDKIRVRRVDQILEAGADTIITACPFCEDNFKRDKRIKTHNILELIKIQKN